MKLEARVRKPVVMDGGWHIDAGVLSFEPLFEQLAGAGFV